MQEYSSGTRVSSKLVFSRSMNYLGCLPHGNETTKTQNIKHRTQNTLCFPILLKCQVSSHVSIEEAHLFKPKEEMRRGR